MAIDWERVIVESDDNGVVVSAGQVSLLIGADADSVSWGNITGDITQQPDLMQIVDGYVSADSPTFTGIPRSVTPPEGNNSTRIATTAFVQGEIAGVRNKVDEAPINNHIWGRKDGNWVQLGEMAAVNIVNTPSETITYGLQNGRMVNIDPPANGSATKKYYLRTSEIIKEGEDTGKIDPKWEQAGTMAIVDEPPISKSNTVDIYARVNGSDGNKEWVLLGAMARVDEPPVNNTSNTKYYVRTSYPDTNNYKSDYGWEELNSNNPPVNTSANVKKRWVMINEGKNGVAVDNPEWEELDEPPWSSASESNPDCYVRTAYMVGTPPNHTFKYGWKKVNL